MTEGEIGCPACRAVFPYDPEIGVCAMTPETDASGTKADIKAFWGDLYRQLYADNDREITPQTLERQVAELEDLFHRRGQSCVVEMKLSELSGKRVLEVGSGSGGHSCIFKRHGAKVTAIDLTLERAASTARKLAAMKGPDSAVYQADAENLPFRDNSFDIVYSNGVLHHSENTEACIAEVRRVLKPGGAAVIMLYSRISAAFLFNILPRAIMTGEIFRWSEAEWIGRLTEGKPKFGTTRNPITRVYTHAQMHRLFAEFEIDSLRKWSFQFDNFCLPRLTQMRRAVMTALGFPLHPGGILAYGQPIVPECRLELWLGRYLGFGWSVAARKPRA